MDPTVGGVAQSQAALIRLVRDTGPLIGPEPSQAAEGSASQVDSSEHVSVRAPFVW